MSSLQSHIVGFDVGKSSVLDFDLLAASSAMDGEAVPSCPRLKIEASDAEIARHLEDYCRRIDRIWNFFVDANIETLAKLAIWVIQKRRTVEASDVDLSMICSAYIYGETDLSLRLLAELEIEWQERLRSEPQPVDEDDTLAFQLTHAIGTAALADLARLRGIIDRSELH